MTEEKDALPCADKLAFDTYQQAKVVAVTSAYQRGSKPGVKPYKCRHCGLWHLATDFGKD